MSLAYCDGSFVDKNELSVGVADFGFSRGIAVFDLARVYRGRPFRLRDHFDRFVNGAEQLGLKVPVAHDVFEKIAHKLCAANKMSESALKLYLTAGEPRLAPHGLAEDHAFKSHFYVIEDEVYSAHPEAPYGMDFYQKGQKIRVMPVERMLPSVKTTVYLQGYVACRQIGADWSDILFTHHDGHVTEVTRANFFCVIDGVLCTPERDMLLGITRRVVLEIAEELGIPVSLCTLYPDDLKKATEAFTTGSIAEIVPIKQINDYILPTTTDGPVYSMIRKAFTAKITAG